MKRKFISLITVISMICSMMPILSITASAEEYIAISNAEELVSFRDSVNSGSDYSGQIVKLTADIDLGGSEENQWTPIGTFVNASNNNPFAGTFDGNGHKISGLYINNASSYQGLFSYNMGTIKNLTVEGEVTNTYSYKAGIVGRNEGTIENCINNVKVTGGNYVGGIAGCNTGTIVDSNNIGEVSGNQYVGGIAGQSDTTGIIESSKNNGTVTCTFSGRNGSVYVGGIAGQNNGKITSCTNIATVIGVSQGSNIGGIVGTNVNGTISNSINRGAVIKCGSYTGGIAGSNNVGTIENSGNTGEITGTIAGGVVGYTYGASIIKTSYNIGAVDGSNTAGGIVAVDREGTIQNCYNAGAITSKSTAGGITYGMNTKGKVQSCYNSGSITASSSYGLCHDYTQAENSFYLDICGARSDRQSGTNISLDKLADINTFSDWDFEDVWEMNEVLARPTLKSIQEEITTNYYIKDNPLIISTKEELEAFRDSVNNCNRYYGQYVILDADIDLGGSKENSWLPIGEYIRKPFVGTFDGNGHKISGLYINNASSYQGLFSYNMGTIKNLTVEGEVTNTYSYKAGIVGRNEGTIENCINNVKVTGGNYVGGIAGCNTGTIVDSNNIGEVSGNQYVGGIAGQSDTTGIIENSRNTGSVTSTFSGGNVYVGGIAGQNNGKVTSCTNDGAVKGNSGNYVGGIAGSNFGTVSNSVNNSGEITGSEIGGVVGTNYAGIIENCGNTGELTGSFVGGVTRNNTKEGKIRTSYNTGTINAQNTAAGIAIVNDNSEISNCYNAGALNGNTVAGITNSNGNNNRVIYSYNTGYLTGYNAYGLCFNSSVANSYFLDICGDKSGDRVNGTSITLDEFADINTFSDWDFEGIWEMSETLGRPVLKATVVDFYTEENPLIIASREDLEAFRDSVNNGNTYNKQYILVTADIDLGGSENNQWLPIGQYFGAYKSKPFTGTFNGDGHRISGLYINNTNSYQSLFSYNMGTIKNLTVEGTLTSGYSTAGIVSRNDGTVESCESNVTVTGSQYAGGAVGINTGTIIGVNNIGDITSSQYVGGIAGHNIVGGTVENSKNAGNITSISGGDYAYAGGIAGYNNRAAVKACINDGTVVGSGNYVGGISAYNYISTVQACVNNGAVTGENYNIGGVVGSNHTGIIEYSSNAGEIRGKGSLGGVAGSNVYESTIKTSHNSGSIAEGTSSGIAGYNNDSKIENCYNAGAVNGCGIIGANSRGSVSNCYNCGDVTDYAVAGNAGTITNCYYLDTCGGAGNGTPISKEELAKVETFVNWDFSGIWKMDKTLGRPILRNELAPTAITGSGTKEDPYVITSAEGLKELSENVNDGNNYEGQYIVITEDIDLNGSEENPWMPIGTTENPFSGTFSGGGHKIIGVHVNDESGENKGLFGYNKGTIENVVVTGSVTGGNNVGGIVGCNEGTVKNCGNLSDVTGKNNVGGIVGENKGTVENCYSIGNVTGDSNVGGVAGNNESGKVTNSYYNKEAYTPEDKTEGVSGKNTESFRNGEVTYLLQSSQTETDENGSIKQVWGQDLSGEAVETYPIISSEDSKKVYKASFKYEKDGEYKEYAAQYANAGGSFTVPESNPGTEYYRFDHWTTNADDITLKYEGTASVTEDVTVYAVGEKQSINLEPGSSVTNKGTTIENNNDGTVTIKKEDGSTADITITLPENGEVSADEDNNVTVPPGSKIDTGNGTEITLPTGGTIDKDGNITGEVIKVGETTITAPEGGKVSANRDGETEAAEGSKVEKDGASVTIDSGKGKVDKEGTITFPEGGEVTVDDGITTKQEVIEPNGTVIPMPAPTATPEPTAEPTTLPTAEPTAEPTASPSSEPTSEPIVGPTAEATASPSSTPDAGSETNPTPNPTEGATSTPIAEATASPSATPDTGSETNPTPNPTEGATATPIAEATASPSATPDAGSETNPTANPSEEPTATPTAEATASPSATPDAGSETNPTANPSEEATATPVVEATASPSATPDAGSETNPTANPSEEPTASPSAGITLPVVLNPGESMSNGGVNISNNTDGTVTIDNDNDGNVEVTITLPEIGNVTVNEDNNVIVPGVSKVKTEDGTEITLPSGGILDKESNIIAGTVEIGDITIIAPDGGKVVTNKGGNTNIPTGSTVKKDDTIVIIESGNAVVKNDGEVTFPEGGTATVKTGDTEKTVTVEENGTISPNPIPTGTLPPISPTPRPHRPGISSGGWISSATPKPTEAVAPEVTEAPTTEATPNPTNIPTDVSSFTDINEKEWYYSSVKYVLENGLMTGTSGTSFAPETEITRGMFVTVLYRLEGNPEAESNYTFADVSKEEYYSKAVAWGSQNGIIEGYSADVFAPNENILREQMAAIVYRYARYKGYDIGVKAAVGYADAESISEYAKNPVVWASEKGIINGNEDNTFAPQMNITRAETAAIFERVAEKLK